MAEVKPKTEGGRQRVDTSHHTQEIIDKWINAGHPDITPPEIFEPRYPPASEP